MTGEFHYFFRVLWAPSDIIGEKSTTTLTTTTTTSPMVVVSPSLAPLLTCCSIRQILRRLMATRPSSIRHVTLNASNFFTSVAHEKRSKRLISLHPNWTHFFVLVVLFALYTLGRKRLDLTTARKFKFLTEYLVPVCGVLSAIFCRSPSAREGAKRRRSITNTPCALLLARPFVFCFYFSFLLLKFLNAPSRGGYYK